MSHHCHERRTSLGSVWVCWTVCSIGVPSIRQMERRCLDSRRHFLDTRARRSTVTGRVRKAPVISLAATTGLIGAISTGGGDPDQVLRSCGLSRRDVSNPQGFVAYSIFARLLETAAQATSDACFGLHFGEHYNPKNAGPVTYLVLNTPTFAAGFETLARYLNTHNEGGRVSFAIEGEWAYVRHEITDPSIESPRQASEYSMAVGRNTIRLMAGSQWTPIEVQFAHPAPSDVAEYTRVFGAPVSFGCTTNAFVIARE